MMTDRPILFSGEMVRAILDGRKTVTRRPVKYVPALGEPGDWCDEVRRLGGSVARYCPFGVPGDRLWVRETWRLAPGYSGDDGAVVQYRDMTLRPVITERYGAMRRYSERWRPSIHMPRWASRITLEVTSIGVERLQDITEDGVRAEGFGSGRWDEFAHAWDAMYEAKGLGWDANPRVWRVSFRRVE